MPVEHYENFPVASLLLPARLREPVEAIYAFARSADDIADEGNELARVRLERLDAYRRHLRSAERKRPIDDPALAPMFDHLGRNIRRHKLPVGLFRDLLDAFSQDVKKTRYADFAELLDYCRRSANPVGRLLLHLYGVTDAQAQQESDAICTALQLINFWQDLSVDIPRGRYYLPLAECAVHGIVISDPARQFATLKSDEKTTNLIAACAHQASVSMQKGLKLVHRIPGRAGWELRAVTQGATRVLDKIDALGAAVLHQQPTVGKADAPRILWRMLRM